MNTRVKLLTFLLSGAFFSPLIAGPVKLKASPPPTPTRRGSVPSIPGRAVGIPIVPTRAISPPPTPRGRVELSPQHLEAYKNLGLSPTVSPQAVEKQFKAKKAQLDGQLERLRTAEKELLKRGSHNVKIGGQIRKLEIQRRTLERSKQLIDARPK